MSDRLLCTGVLLVGSICDINLRLFMLCNASSALALSSAMEAEVDRAGGPLPFLRLAPILSREAVTDVTPPTEEDDSDELRVECQSDEEGERDSAPLAGFDTVAAPGLEDSVAGGSADVGDDSDESFRPTCSPAAAALSPPVATDFRRPNMASAPAWGGGKESKFAAAAAVCWR